MSQGFDQGQAQMGAALFELQQVSAMYEKMGRACYAKCAVSFKEGELNVGEMSCTDRCVGKYVEAQKIVQEKFTAENERANAAAAAQAVM